MAPRPTVGGALVGKGTFCLSQSSWCLPGQDSNLGQGIQSPVCYHYTTGHSCCGAGPPARAATHADPPNIPHMPPRLPFSIRSHSDACVLKVGTC